MRVFLTEPLETEEQIESKLVCEERRVCFPDKWYRPVSMPLVTWEAYDMIIAMGVESSEVASIAKDHSVDTGYPFEITYAYTIHYVAHLVAGDAPRQG